MQLFSIGVYLLNMDGTPKISPNTGLPIPTYHNSNIQTFARAWTGYLRQSARGNIENFDWTPNRIDPMALYPRWRDVFPKMDLYGGYIGDSYPLCEDLPRRQFLNVGAKYILLGSSAIPEYQTGDEWWSPDSSLAHISLNSTSSALYAALCNQGSDGLCHYLPVVTLNETLTCQGNECLVDELRTIRLSENPSIFYEYIRPACVELTFYSNGRLVRNNVWSEWPGICANPSIDKAYEACCTGCGSWGCVGSSFCLYTGEKVLYNTAINRCSAYTQFSDGALCNWTGIDDSYYSNAGCHTEGPDDWHWTNQTCSVKTKGEAGIEQIVSHIDREFSFSVVMLQLMTQGESQWFIYLNHYEETCSRIIIQRIIISSQLLGVGDHIHLPVTIAGAYALLKTDCVFVTLQ